MDTEIKKLLGKVIVLDTDTRWLYVGTLKKIGKTFLTLEDVDAHDLTETGSTRDLHLANIKNNGLIINRGEVLVDREKLTGLSLLKDVKP
jgi:hypothetical protein